jgi:hypothetical protein
MQKNHSPDAERPFVAGLWEHHYARRETRNANVSECSKAFRKCMDEGGTDMTTRFTARRRLPRPVAKALARPRELFGESLPELLLVTAVVTAVVSALLALDGAG